MSECIYILLPVHNRCKITRKFIESLIQQTYDNYHLLLIDDGSVDGTDEMVQALISEDKLTVIKGLGDWWWAGSLQQGLNWLKSQKIQESDVILMINDDVIFESDFFQSAVSFLRNEPNVLLLSQYYNEEQGTVCESGVKANMRYLSFIEADKPENINCLSTRGLFMRWKVCEAIGGFYPRILPHYTSDYEFTMRAHKKGFVLLTVPSVYLIPDHSTTGIRSPEDIQSIQILFSKRCAMNPVYWTVFIFLSSPIKWVPLNLTKIWLRTFRVILNGIIR